jgi:hypothetical protein
MNESQAPAAKQFRTCAYCRASTPVNHANGVVISYKSTGKVDIEVSLHKSCAAAWSKRFAHSIPIEIAAVE